MSIAVQQLGGLIVFSLLFVFPYIFINIHVWAIKGGGNEASPEKNRYWYFTPFGCEFYIERCFSCTDMLDAYMDGCEVMLAVGRWRLTFTPYWFKALPSPIEVSLVHKGFKVMGGSRVAKQATG